MDKRPQYTQEFKDQAVRLTLLEDTTIDQVARDLGISTGALVSWRHKAGVSEARSSGGGVTLLKRENEELRRKNQQLEKEKKAVEMERDIVKKAAAFFAKNLA